MPAPPARPLRRSRLTAVLDAIERLGNALPDPATMFLILAGLVVAASALIAQLGVTVTHPRDGSTIAAVNLLSRDGVRRMLSEAVRNFVGFAPLGTVLVAMLGIGVAEGTGLVAAAMRGFVLGVPRKLLTSAVVFAGILGHQAADAGIILLPPLGAMLFAAAGRHPLAGIAAAFAGVSGAFSANFMPSTLDVLLAGITQAAVDASKFLPGYRVLIVGNLWFMMTATPLLTVLGTWITHRFVEPRLGEWKGSAEGPALAHGPLTAEERRGLRAAGLALLLTAAAIVALTLPGAPLRGPGETLLQQLQPLFDSLVTLVFVVFFVPGLAYGLATGSIRSDRDVMRMTSAAMATMAGYIVLAFCAAQFVSYFSWSNLGSIVAIGGAQGLRTIGLQGAPLIVGLILFTASLNLIITSASAKWAMVGPVFVPMFLLLGFSPEGTQCIFRIGDSCTNIVTPLMPYMPFILASAQRYEPRAGTGTIITLMLPYSAFFLVSWTALLVLFYALGWDIGPGIPLLMPR